jgi:membrane-associated phospholipid phosphatase
VNNNKGIDSPARHSQRRTEPGLWSRLILFLQTNRPVAWLVIILIALAFFLAFLPAPVRDFFWRSLREHSLLASMLFIFSLLALSLIWTTGQRIDAWAFLVFNLRGSRPAWLDWLMLAFTQIGNGFTSLGFAVFWYVGGLRLLAYELVLGTLTLWLVVELFKALVRRSRPFIRIEQTRIVGRQAWGRSFPSGHTSQAFFLATLMIQNFPLGGWAILLLYGIALLVGITRMYVGAHYPRDVLAGLILGSAWGLLVGLASGGIVLR